jgi:hypothetical protein
VALSGALMGAAAATAYVALVVVTVNRFHHLDDFIRQVYQR